MKQVDLGCRNTFKDLHATFVGSGGRDIANVVEVCRIIPCQVRSSKEWRDSFDSCLVGSSGILTESSLPIEIVDMMLMLE